MEEQADAQHSQNCKKIAELEDENANLKMLHEQHCEKMEEHLMQVCKEDQKLELQVCLFIDLCVGLSIYKSM
jgi:hypothetical protein